ncbi:peptidyl-prolyl cis-trans isomerase, cyclophilin type [Paraglaciecola sp. T6c]|uniref:peptidylprolyl isomerase n=1 Tax=Pseudoalteromonas atlantica (strain T6c / ATCC BAA-1087) TaxID=3042615 RepID=UPI00005C7597|nr:peptidylprolyl isomerase [Paraglaciecola sp. T6c]ABG39690.1 peptidyl-prolyl cis-trans isomerase, cyclophilin type [Paraglaciecola sp. T6c]
MSPYPRSILLSLVLLSLTNSLFASAQTPLTSQKATQQAVIQTALGNIEIALFAQKAPVTVANFIAYIQQSAFTGGEFYRVVGPDNDQGTPPISVIQGRTNPQFEDFPPIVLETTKLSGIKHKDGTLSMARGGPNTATQQFFICVGEQSSLDYGGARNPDGQGFAAFGRVTAGMDIVKKIQRNRQAKVVEDPYIKNQILAQSIKIIAITLAE